MLGAETKKGAVTVFYYFLFISPILTFILFNTQSVVQFDWQNIGPDTGLKNFLNKNNNSNLRLECEPFFSSPNQYVVEIDGEMYPKSVALFHNRSINFKCLNKNEKKPVILFWNGFFSDPHYSYKDSGFERNKCPVTNCETTTNKSRYNESNLVITHMRNSWSLGEFPTYRPDTLRTVFLLYESPYHSPDFAKYNGFFNLTSTYRLDSDFAHFYEEGMRWERNGQFNRSRDFHGEKGGFAAALISNCHDRSGRMEYIERLRKHVGVDVYGKCGASCPTRFADGSEGDCRAVLARKYKFFLAFENSVCDEYVTEKFFRTVKYDTIPVVHGGGRYEKFIPKSGYLNTKDFESVEKLANRLKEISKSKSVYNSFFKWKEHVIFDQKIAFSPICTMCIQLNLEQRLGIQKRSVITNIGEYWNVNKNCR